jgi:predicted transcriptional regulator
MEACYQILTTIYEIVKTDPAPETYLCTPHQIILRQSLDWTSFQQHLEMLATEKLITIKQLDKMAVCITPAGIAKAKSLKNNFVNNNFSFSKSDEESMPAKPL